MQDRWFGPAEMAKRLGVSVKTLRVYERVGLLEPARTQAGWRAYGPAEQARPHQILALKRLGLSLADIGRLLAGRLSSLDAVLALQQRVLEARRAEADHGLRLLASARRKLVCDGALSPDDLMQLTQETVMTDAMSENEWKNTLQPLIDKHFSPEEQTELEGRKSAFDQVEIARGWDALIAEGKRLRDRGDPGSAEAMDLARRWMVQVEKFTGGDPAMLAKSAALNREALGDPEVAPKMPFDLALWQFVGEAHRRLKASGAA